MAQQQCLLDLVASINTNIHKKYINIIFLYAGPATNELTICKELVKQNFIINNIFLHDSLYRDDNYSRGVKRLFNTSGFKKLIFSRTCENIEETVVEEDEASTDDDDDEKFEEPYTVCIACNPQTEGVNNGINQYDGVNDGEDINNFISTFFSSEKNNFIFTTVHYIHFVLYTKQNHIACVNNPANIHRPQRNGACFFDTIYQIQPPVYYHGGKRKNRRKSCKRKRKSCKRKTNKYKRK